MENVEKGCREHRLLTVFEIGNPRSRRAFIVVQFPGIILGKSLNGGVAHLGERLNGIQEVVGSIPIVSTTVMKSPRVCSLKTE